MVPDGPKVEEYEELEEAVGPGELVHLDEVEGTVEQVEVDGSGELEEDDGTGDQVEVDGPGDIF